MARYILSLQFLLCLLTRQAFATTVIDSSGSINRRASPLSATSKGVVAIISSPGDVSDRFSEIIGSDNESSSVTVDVDSNSGCIFVRAQGATLGGTSDLPSILLRGSGSTAAASVAGSIVLTGITPADCDGIVDTRHGKTLHSIFASRLDRTEVSESEDDDSEKKLLILAVEGDDVDENSLLSEISSIFDACAVSATGTSDVSLDDIFEIKIISVNSSDDAETVISAAVTEGSRSPLSQTSGNVVSAIADAYTKSSSISGDSPIVSETILISEDSFTRNARSVRAKFAVWKSRVNRSLPIEKFGLQATTLLKRTMDSFDKDTIAASGLDGAASYRLELRSSLKAKLEEGIKALFEAQAETIEKNTLKKFNSMLLRQKKKSSSPADGEDYQDNAAAVRSAAFAFDTAISDLEVPSLSLKKDKYTQAMAGKLNNALSSFPDSAAAQLSEMKTVQKMASRSKKPTQTSIDVGFGLVAMIRPDGFGNLQGFTGYSSGSNTVTVGFHNDADAPETISQFGGSRPPFLRVQPKLNLDIEL